MNGTDMRGLPQDCRAILLHRSIGVCFKKYVQMASCKVFVKYGLSTFNPYQI